MPPQISLDAAGLTDRGVQRETNEDFWGGPPPNLMPEQAAAKGYLYIVADGVGGHRGGEVASRIAVQVSQQVYYADSNPDIGASLQAAIQEANRRIYHQAISNPDRFGMSTTVTAAVARGDELVVANVGDSRTYLVRGGQARQLTVDHTWVEEQRRASLLTDQEAADHPQRNVITRSLGGKLDVRVDVFRERLAPGDALLLCTDGLSDLVTPQEIAREVGQRRSPKAAVRRLVDLAKGRDAPDNVTALVVGVGRGKKRAAAAIRSGWGNALALVAILGTVLAIGALSFLVGPSAQRHFPILFSRSVVSTPIPSPSPSPTLTPTPVATSTPLPTPELTAPEEGDTFYPDEEVILSWAWAALQPGQRFLVIVENAAGSAVLTGTMGPGADTVYTFRPGDVGLGEGTYRWRVWVEREVEGEWKVVTQEGEWRTFVVQKRPTPVPLTPTPVPPTATPPPPTPPPTPPATQPPSCSPPTDPCAGKWELRDPEKCIYECVRD